MFREFTAVGIGGFIGSCARYQLAKILAYFTLLYPYGTLLSNVLAGAAVGLIFGAAPKAGSAERPSRLFFASGIFGGLCAFSTFVQETTTFLHVGRYVAAITNIGLNLGLSLTGAVIGFAGASRAVSLWRAKRKFKEGPIC
ncbi:MAG: CrcB family protein [Synergistaceae bacterium]|jgi:CrcB protein|nr:CrcB family protein [Synergistaceae bacterium]